MKSVFPFSSTTRFISLEPAKSSAAWSPALFALADASSATSYTRPNRFGSTMSALTGAGAASATTWYATASRNFPSSVETMTVARPGRSASMIFPASSTRTTAGSELAMLNGFAPTVS